MLDLGGIVVFRFLGLFFFFFGGGGVCKCSLVVVSGGGIGLPVMVGVAGRDLTVGVVILGLGILINLVFYWVVSIEGVRKFSSF